MTLNIVLFGSNLKTSESKTNTWIQIYFIIEHFIYILKKFQAVRERVKLGGLFTFCFYYCGIMAFSKMMEIYHHTHPSVMQTEVHLKSQESMASQQSMASKGRERKRI